MIASGEPLVSVILPTRNRAISLVAAVRSVLDQSFGDLELLVIDDASTDETLAVIEAIVDPRLRILAAPERRGVSGARNDGLVRAEGRFVAFQDSDDVWLPEALERNVAALAAAPPEVAVAYAAVEKHHRDGTRRVPNLDRQILEGDLSAELVLENFIDLPAALVRAEALREVGGFDERLSRLVDWDLWLSLSGRGRKFVHVPHLAVEKADTPGSVTSDVDGWFVAIDLLLEKHAALFAACPDAAAVYELQLVRHHVGKRRLGKALTHMRASLRAGWRETARATLRKARRVAGA